MHKQLHLLGLLLSGPRTGYDLHRIVQAHGELFTDLKQGNVYYLLERLTAAGDLEVSAEASTRGPRRERMSYALTVQGHQHFADLLQEILRTYDLPHSGIEVGMLFLASLPRAEAITLLDERLQVIIERRRHLEQESHHVVSCASQLAQEHLRCHVEAEQVWTERVLLRLRQPEEKERHHVDESP